MCEGRGAWCCQCHGWTVSPREGAQRDRRGFPIPGTSGALALAEEGEGLWPEGEGTQEDVAGGGLGVGGKARENQRLQGGRGQRKTGCFQEGNCCDDPKLSRG